MPSENPPSQKEVVSVKEMAAMLHLSRSRLHMLIAEGVFLPPVYDLETRRPRYTRELIEANVDARRRNCGVNGRPVCFYAPRTATAFAPMRQQGARRVATPSRVPASRAGRQAELIDGLAALGVEASEAQVEAALTTAFPQDRGASADAGLRLREVYRCLQRSIAAEHSSHNVRS